MSTFYIFQILVAATVKYKLTKNYKIYYIYMLSFKCIIFFLYPSFLFTKNFKRLQKDNINFNVIYNILFKNILLCNNGITLKKYL